ncbi:MAG: hypothetical protein FJ091_08185 [Deltaproteobacteria bacterium]|nr:hypothetical protein [Deltaproteobacteria bacterium]
MARLKKKDPGAARQQQVETLADRGFALLEEGEFKKALTVATQLKELRWSGGFEIEARAHAGLGDLARATACLESGVEVAPDAWANWQLLGSYRSDRGDFIGAEVAYTRALSCPGADQDAITLNRAILATRQADPERALRLASEVRHPDLAARTISVRMRALELSGKTREALAIGVDATRPDAGISPDDVRMLVSRVVHLRLVLGDNRLEIRTFLRRHWSPDIDSAHLLAAFRELDGVEANEHCGYFYLLVQARLLPGHPEATHAEGYFARFHAVAPSAKEALPFVARLLDERAELRVSESERLEARSQGFQGVYWSAPGRTYFETA